jgi:hypothetical protein
MAEDIDDLKLQLENLERCQRKLVNIITKLANDLAIYHNNDDRDGGDSRTLRNRLKDMEDKLSQL